MGFGVCAGFAQTFNLPHFWIRTLLVLAFVFTGFFPIGFLYLLAALLMKVEPPLEPKSPSEWEFYNSYASSKSLPWPASSRGLIGWIAEPSGWRTW
jgi:phage shock protein C